MGALAKWKPWLYGSTGHMEALAIWKPWPDSDYVKSRYKISYSINDRLSTVLFVKVSKSRKQNTKFSNTPKNQQNFVHFFPLASKKWLK